MLRLAILLCLVAGPVQALSCLAPDAVRLYERARDSEAFYTVVRGRIAGEVVQPRPDPQGQVEPGTVLTSTVRVVGVALDADGFDVPFDQPVDVNVTCAGPWCGGASDGEAILALRHTEKGLQLEAGPCAADQVPVSDTGIDRLLACHRAGICLAGR